MRGVIARIIAWLRSVRIPRPRIPAIHIPHVRLPRRNTVIIIAIVLLVGAGLFLAVTNAGNIVAFVGGMSQRAERQAQPAQEPQPAQPSPQTFKVTFDKFTLEIVVRSEGGAQVAVSTPSPSPTTPATASPKPTTAAVATTPPATAAPRPATPAPTPAAAATSAPTPTPRPATPTPATSPPTQAPTTLAPASMPAPTPRPKDDFGNSVETATLIVVPVSVSGKIDPADDIDFFRFVAQGGSQHVIEAPLGSHPDIILTLYDSGGKVLDEKDDVVPLGKGAKIVWTPTVTGTYFASVRSYDRTNEKGSYTLTVSTVVVQVATPTPAPAPAPTVATLSYGTTTVPLSQAWTSWYGLPSQGANATIVGSGGCWQTEYVGWGIATSCPNQPLPFVPPEFWSQFRVRSAGASSALITVTPK